MLAPSIIFLAGIAAAGCDAARAHYEALAFDDALASLGTVSAPEPDCLEVRALVMLALGRQGEAEKALQLLFAAAPDHPIDMRALAPADRAFIQRVRDASRPLALSLTAGWLVHTTLRLRFELDGGLRRARQVRFRARVGTAVKSGVVPLVGRVATTTVSVDGEVEAKRVDLRAEVIDVDGIRLYEYETQRDLPARPAPTTVEVSTESASIPWWVWTIGAAVVAGATITTVILVQPSAPDASGTLGRIEVP